MNKTMWKESGKRNAMNSWKEGRKTDSKRKKKKWRETNIKKRRKEVWEIKVKCILKEGQMQRERGKKEERQIWVGKRNAKYIDKNENTNAKQRGNMKLRQMQRTLGMMIEDKPKWKEGIHEWREERTYEYSEKKKDKLKEKEEKRKWKADVKRRMKKGRQTNTSNLLIPAGRRLVYHVIRSKMAAFIERSYILKIDMYLVMGLRYMIEFRYHIK